MTDYNSLKVPDLKKMLGDRSLPLSGNKSDLITRLQEDDKKPKTSAAVVAAPPVEDEIDWDEDDTKETTAPAAPAAVVADKTQVANPAAVPNQKPDIEPAKTEELKVPGGKEVPTSVGEAKAAAVEPTAEVAAAPVIEETPKADFSIGLEQTDADKEAEKRTARAKRFGITEDDEEKKKLERAKKFGTDKETVVKGLDNALPERRAKRGREGDKQGGRAAKRQTPDRRTEVASANAAKSARPVKPVKPMKSAKPATGMTAAVPAKKAVVRVVDDPAEKAKAEARAKRFQTAA